MNSTRFDIALAGLLHDIGKIEQRALDDPWNTPQGFPKDGQPVHARWSEYFIQNYVPSQYRPAAYQGVYHHQPEKSPAEDQSRSKLVALADKLSAGERSDDIKEEKGNHPPQQLLSIFDRVGAYRQKSEKQQHYLPLRSLALNEKAIFPSGSLDRQATKLAYEELRDQLRAEAKKDIHDPETYLENVLAALQRNAWSIPSAFYYSLPDVSLYDHSRMTAALAVCLSDLPDPKINDLLSAVREAFQGNTVEDTQGTLSEPVGLLVGGDISGIQNFIYTLSSKNAAKTLRGRSFYLQLLTEAVLRFVLRELDLPTTNVIYSGGGHFYLLAPLSAEKQLKEIQLKVTRILLKHHGANLYLALGWVPVPASGFKRGVFPTYWDKMHSTLAQVKQHRYQELGSEIIAQVFEPQPHGGNQENTCSVCGEEKKNTQALQDESEEGTTRICDLCASFDTALGRRLPDAGYVLLSLGQPEAREPGTALDVLAEFGMGVQFYDQHQTALKDGQILKNAERGVLWSFNDPTHWPDTGKLPSAHLLRYTVNQVPNMTFDKLAESGEGIKRLGVLRMDVDNLGNLFKSGFGSKPSESIATVARISTLSFQMSLYFEGWVKKICEKYENVYAVYSGGDDLFLIAPWHIVPGLAMEIEQGFEKYTSQNPDLHLSGGMTFIHGKYPVYQAADDAGEALDMAKNNPGKRSFTFLGHVWTWKEFADLTSIYNRLVNICKREGGPSSLLQLLQRLANMEAKKITQKGTSVWGPWMWLAAYQFSRMIENTKNPELKAELEKMNSELKQSYYQNLRTWGIAARWTQLFVRNTQKASQHS